jgi:hypothetical protein
MYACSRSPQPTSPTADRSLVNQRLLWGGFGLFRDKPIVLVRIHASSAGCHWCTSLRAHPVRLWQVMDPGSSSAKSTPTFARYKRDIVAMHERTISKHSFRQRCRFFCCATTKSPVTKSRGHRLPHPCGPCGRRTPLDATDAQLHQLRWRVGHPTGPLTLHLTPTVDTCLTPNPALTPPVAN